MIAATRQQVLVGYGSMERRTPREQFWSTAVSITDDLLHRNILLLRADFVAKVPNCRVTFLPPEDKPTQDR
jgi:hypothetical protein